MSPVGWAMTASARPSPVTSPAAKRHVVAGSGPPAPSYQVARLKAEPVEQKTSSRPVSSALRYRHRTSVLPSLSASPAASLARPALYVPRQNVFLTNLEPLVAKTKRRDEVVVLL